MSAQFCEPLNSRITNLKNIFETRHEHLPDFIVRSPGRVNLIGEHIDYCGYSVLPMAIEQAIFIAVGKNSNFKLNITNINSKYPEFSCDINDFSIDGLVPLWHKYLLCGIQGMKDHGINLSGLDLVVDGNIPPSAGLSSSSALVCAAALAALKSQDVKLTMSILADKCAEAERYIGTQGGGMDQAACLLSSKGTAIKINFNPLTTEKTKLPIGATFVVGNSLVSANKAASNHYNCRVMECRLSAKIIALKEGINFDDSVPLKLKDLQSKLNKPFEEMLNLVKLHLHPEPYSQQEICSILDITSEELKTDVLTKNTVDIEAFQLHDRAMHVFSEAARVQEFKSLCDDFSMKLNPSEQECDLTLKKLGQVMNQSHQSTRYLYCCSHPKLDTLVDIAQKMAYGARLTGAGWGGCMVALVAEDKVEAFKEFLQTEFYDHEESAKDRNANSYLFNTQPENGASILL